MEFIINPATRISAQWQSEPLARAVERFRRDMRRTLEKREAGIDNEISVCYSAQMERESYTITIQDRLHLIICAPDDLGAVYALADLSRITMGVQPFWFWNEQKFIRHPNYSLKEERIESAKPAVRWRGWAVTDEVLLRHWANENNHGWEMLFEALLRCGGNLVIPGSVSQDDDLMAQCMQLASSMGLFVGQSAQYPLGATPFAAVWQGLEPCYAENQTNYRYLWADALQRQKGLKVLWTLGLPAGEPHAWEGNPDCETDEQCALCLTELVQEQYDMVRRVQPLAEFCIYLSGEEAELFRDGLVDIPDDVTIIWEAQSDALPQKGVAGHHGVYLPLTMGSRENGALLLPAPNLPQKWTEPLLAAHARGLDDLWLVECGNLRPHVLLMDFIARLWHNPETTPEDGLTDYLHRYYVGSNGWMLTPFEEDLLKTCLKAWGENTVFPGDKAGYGADIFLNGGVRALAAAWLCGKTDKPIDALAWFAPGCAFGAQLERFRTVCAEALPKAELLLSGCECTADRVKGLWETGFYAQVRCYVLCLRGAIAFCDGFALYEAEDYPECFYRLCSASNAFEAGFAALSTGEAERWNGFYDGDCISDCLGTAKRIRQLLPPVRLMGEGVDCTLWQKDLLPTLVGALPEPSLSDAELFDALHRRKLAAAMVDGTGETEN